MTLKTLKGRVKGPLVDFLLEKSCWYIVFVLGV